MTLPVPEHHLFEGLTPQQFVETAQEVLEMFGPDVRLHKNQVGNLAVLDAAGDYVGWVDLRSGGAHDIRGRE